MVKCPILNKEIDPGECVVTVDCCDGLVKESALSKAIIDNEKWKEICKKCEYHNN